jgi:hypothetical protein
LNIANETGILYTMANIDLHSILSANASLSREKKELVRLIRLMTRAVEAMSVTTSKHGETITTEATKYRAIPKGFLVALLQERISMEDLLKQTLGTTKKINDVLDGLVGNDEELAETYYESLIDDLMRREEKTNSVQDFFTGTIGPDGKWHFNSKWNDQKTNEYYNKHKDLIDKMINDSINFNMFPNNMFPKIDPNNLGGDLEGEWQDGMSPEDDVQ